MFPEILHGNIFASEMHDHYYISRKLTKTAEMINRNGSIQAVREETGMPAKFDIRDIFGIRHRSSLKADHTF